MLGVIVLVMFALTIDVGGLLNALTGVDSLFLLIALGFSWANIVLKAVRWRLMIKEVSNTEVSSVYATVSVFAGVAGASLLPGRAFEITKPIMLRTSHDIPVGKTLPAVLFERLLDLAALFAVFLVSTLFVSARIQSDNTATYIAAAVGLLGLIIVIWRPQWGLLLLRKLTRPFDRFPNVAKAVNGIDNFIQIWQHGDVKFSWSSLSIAAMLAEIARAYAIFAAFDIDISPGLIAFAFSGSILVGLLSLIPGGIGVTETSQFGFLTILLPGVADGALQGAVLLDRFISYYLLVGIGAVVLLFVGRRGRLLSEQVGTGSEVVGP